jgi:predicted ATP-dependent endonuclease of OLD family
MVLLLDEPGPFLHANAQADLLNYVEKELRPHHQVIYTTHSPFMVDPQHLERVRLVEDESIEADDDHEERDQLGTVVLKDIFEAKRNTLFPLQHALGYDLAQTLFVGPNCLVVEGVSDLMYLQAISETLRSQGREGLSDGWVITPVGGSDKVPTFVALLGAQRGLTIATLIDLQKKDEHSIENLYKKKLLKKSNVITFADFVSAGEADIEDMFEVGFYLKLVNGEFGTHLSNPIAEGDLQSQAPRVLVRIEEHLGQSPMQGAVFSHYRPARYFVENQQTLMPQVSSDTWDRFEAAFKKLNQLLPTSS